MSVGALAGRRVSLRTIADREAAALESWYVEAASAAYESRFFEELVATAGDAEGDLFAIAQSDGEDSIGLIEYRHDGGWLAISFIALAKAYRGWGYGSEAVRLLEEWAVREGVAERFRADVDARNGLGLYFWLRLGYRPALAGECDWRTANARDMMPMVRISAST